MPSNFSAGNDGGVIIDMSGMQSVYLDPADRVGVEGGATLWNTYETLFRDHNLAWVASFLSLVRSLIRRPRKLISPCAVPTGEFSNGVWGFYVPH